MSDIRSIKRPMETKFNKSTKGTISLRSIFLFVFTAIFFVLNILPPFQYYAEAETLVFYDGDLIRERGDNKVYLLSPGRRRWIRNIEVFNSYNFKWEDVRVVPPVVLTVFEFTNLLRQGGDKKVYLINESGFKRHIPSPQVFASYDFDWDDVALVPSIEIQSYPESRLIREEGDKKVYFIENSTKRWIETAEIFNSQGFDWNEVRVVNTTESNFFEVGETITPQAPKVEIPVSIPEPKEEPEEIVQEEVTEPVSATTTEPTSATTTEPIATVPLPDTETSDFSGGGGGGGGGTPAPAADTTAPSSPPPCETNIASGSQLYNVTSAGQPQIQGVTLNPLDIQQGTSQTITITARDTNDNPITSMSAVIITDSGSSSAITLSLNSGSETSGTWQGSWTATSAPCTIYEIRVTATSASGTSNVTLAFL